LTTVAPPTSDGGTWTERYEQLRRQVLAGDNRGPGLAILLNRGMRSWLAVASSFAADPTPPRSDIVADAGALESVPGECRNQLTAVLAGMVLHGFGQWRHA